MNSKADKTIHSNDFGGDTSLAGNRLFMFSPLNCKASLEKSFEVFCVQRRAFKGGKNEKEG